MVGRQRARLFLWWPERKGPAGGGKTGTWAPSPGGRGERRLALGLGSSAGKRPQARRSKCSGNTWAEPGLLRAGDLELGLRKAWRAEGTVGLQGTQGRLPAPLAQTTVSLGTGFPVPSPVLTLPLLPSLTRATRSSVKRPDPASPETRPPPAGASLPGFQGVVTGMGPAFSLGSILMPLPLPFPNGSFSPGRQLLRERAPTLQAFAGSRAFPSQPRSSDLSSLSLILSSGNEDNVTLTLKSCYEN